jgi:hypothetical protein
MIATEAIRMTPEASKEFGEAIERAVEAAVSDRSGSSVAQAPQELPRTALQNQTA